MLVPSQHHAAHRALSSRHHYRLVRDTLARWSDSGAADADMAACCLCTADRVFGILRERNPELTGERRRTVLKPPQVAREGTKKTVFTNFMDLCKVRHGFNQHAPPEFSDLVRARLLLYKQLRL